NGPIAPSTPRGKSKPIHAVWGSNGLEGSDCFRPNRVAYRARIARQYRLSDGCAPRLGAGHYHSGIRATATAHSPGPAPGFDPTAVKRIARHYDQGSGRRPNSMGAFR